jgi:hypothetical protein
MFGDNIDKLLFPMIEPRMMSDTIISPIQYFPFMGTKIDLESISHIIYPSEDVYLHKGSFGHGRAPSIGFSIYFRSDIPMENNNGTKLSRTWDIPGTPPAGKITDRYKLGSKWEYDTPRYRDRLVERLDELSVLWEKVKLQYLAN